MKRHPTCHKMAPQEVWKWCPTCCEMAPDELENVNQCCFNKFDCRLFVSKFSQFTFHLFLSHSVISKSLAQLFCKCYSLSLSIVLNVRFTTNGMCVTEMSGLWNFLVRVQSWPDKIEYEPVLIRKIFENHQSDPVLIHQCKIIHFCFASWGKRSTQAILPFANYDCLKGKYFQQSLCLMRQNRHSLSAFPKFNKKVSTRHLRQKHCWSYFSVRRVQLVGLIKWQGR